MRELLGVGLALIALTVSIMIGGAMVSKTENVTAEIVSDTTLIDALGDDAEEALTTFTSLLPLLALAVIGGLALGYIMLFGVRT